MANGKWVVVTMLKDNLAVNNLILPPYISQNFGFSPSRPIFKIVLCSDDEGINKPNICEASFEQKWKIVLTISFISASSQCSSKILKYNHFDQDI